MLEGGEIGISQRELKAIFQLMVIGLYGVRISQRELKVPSTDSDSFLYTSRISQRELKVSFDFFTFGGEVERGISQRELKGGG